MRSTAAGPLTYFDFVAGYPFHGFALLPRSLACGSLRNRNTNGFNNPGIGFREMEGGQKRNRAGS